MKMLFIVVSLLFTCQRSAAQEPDPVTWQYTVKQTGSKTYEVYFTATIKPGWHIYAQKQPKDAVAAPTAIHVSKNPLVLIKGVPIEMGNKSKQFVEELDITQYYYSLKVDFVQEVELKNKVKTALSGTISYMACTDERCLPEKRIPFMVKIDAK